MKVKQVDLSQTLRIRGMGHVAVEAVPGRVSTQIRLIQIKGFSVNVGVSWVAKLKSYPVGPSNLLSSFI